MANIIYGMFNVARTALITQQKAIDVTANNIANVNTEGYSRQRVTLEQNEPVYYEGGTLGTGVQANRVIQRIYDRFINQQLAESESELGRWEAELESLEKAELMFDEMSGYGLNDAMAQFWNSWQELSNDPSGYAERVTLIANTQNLTDVFNSLSTNLTQVQSDSDASIIGAVNDINTLSSEIAGLNLKIAAVEAGSLHSANDFRDQRDLKLQELSALIDVDSFEDADGYLTITTANGNTLVDRTNSWELTTHTVDGFEDVYWVSGTGTEENITEAIDNGKLKGWIEARDTIIPGYLEDLDDLAAGIISAVNGFHAAGTDLTGTTGTASGLDFFTGADASDIEINTNIADNPNLIAAASTSEAIPGGSENAVAIAELQNDLLMGGGTATFDDFYNSLAGDVGNDVYQAKVNGDHQTTVNQQLATYQQEVSGVSLDEEMVDLIQFQSAYEAAAKLVTTVDEMLENLIAMV